MSTSPYDPNSPIFTKCYAMVSWIIERSTDFPRHKRETLSTRPKREDEPQRTQRAQRY